MKHKIGVIRASLQQRAAQNNVADKNDFSQVADDNRLFLEVDVLGRSMCALLDSGASMCVVGGPGMALMSELNLPSYKSKIKRVELADKSRNQVLGQVDLPITLSGKTFLIPALMVPTVEQGLILGLNFWHSTGFIPDVARGTWSLSSENSCSHKLGALKGEDGDALREIDRRKIVDFVSEFREKFPPGLGRTNIMEHVIDTGDAAPIKCKQHYIAPPQLTLIQKQVDDLLALDVIEEAVSPWSSPVFIVNVEGKDPRFVMDMRKVNSVTVADAYGVEHMSSVLDNLGDFKYISTVDFKKSYWQVGLTAESKPKTAFYCPGRGQFQFKVVPFGAINSGPGWMRVFDKVLAGSWIRPYIKNYIDDCFIGTPTLDLHFKVLAEFFRLLLAANLTPNWEKCKFLRSSFKILGYILDSKGLHPDPDKVASILQLARPKNASEVKTFLGAVSYYRRFVNDFSTIVEPITKLTRKKNSFVWETDQEAAYTRILSLLVSDPIVRLPDFTRRFYLSTDASDVGISGVLSQIFDDGEHPVHCVSRVLTDTEMRYPTIHKEALAVIWSIERLEGYLAYGRFTWRTDNKPLKFMKSVDCPKGRAGNWIYRLQKYDYDVEFIPGALNNLPDYMSRFCTAVRCATISLGRNIADRWFLDLRDKVRSDPHKYPFFRCEGDKLFKLIKSKVPWEDAVYRQIIPKELRQKILHECHCTPEGGHFGFYKTFNKIAENFYWPKMRSDIARFLANCRHCQEQKSCQSAPAGSMSSHIVEQPWQVVCSDLVGELPRSASGFKWVLTQVDLFSKYVILTPLRDGTAKSVCAALEKSILHFGAMELLIQDNAQVYNSGQFKDMAKKYGVRLQYTPRYHPQANPAERVNRVFETVMRCFVSENQRDWDRNLPQIAFAINSSLHETTRYSPNFLFYSRNLSLYNHDMPRANDDAVADPMANFLERFPKIRKIREDVRQKMAEANARNAHHYNLRRRPSPFKVGDRVMKRNFAISKKGEGISAKLTKVFVGPYILKEQKASNMFSLVDVQDQTRYIGDFDVKDLKLFTGPK